MSKCAILPLLISNSPYQLRHAAHNVIIYYLLKMHSQLVQTVANPFRRCPDTNIQMWAKQSQWLLLQGTIHITTCQRHRYLITTSANLTKPLAVTIDVI